MKKAQGLIEYGLILALVAVVTVVILGKFSNSVSTVGTQANTSVEKAQSSVSKMCTNAGGTLNAAGQCIPK